MKTFYFRLLTNILLLLRNNGLEKSICLPAVPSIMFDGIFENVPVSTEQ